MDSENESRMMKFYEQKAEEAYDRLYECHSFSEATAAYSDCKEFLHDAIRTARALGLETEAERLGKRLVHIKSVFRSQFSGSSAFGGAPAESEPAPPEDAMIAGIRQNAELVVRQLKPLSGIDFGFNAESVSWVDGYINRLRREDLPEETRISLSGVLGSFLGECIIHRFGGTWKYVGGQLAVAFDDRNAVFPFSKVEKQFQSGPEEGIESFFEAIPVLFANIAGVKDKSGQA